MDDLLSFLLFAGFFYIMMRYGCGAHMMRGRGRSHSQSHESSHTEKLIDPVCGMEVKVDQGYGKIQDGVLTRFCSRSCLDKFDESPEQYLKPSNLSDNGGGE